MESCTNVSLFNVGEPQIKPLVYNAPSRCCYQETLYSATVHARSSHFSVLRCSCCRWQYYHVKVSCAISSHKSQANVTCCLTAMHRLPLSRFRRAPGLQSLTTVPLGAVACYHSDLLHHVRDCGIDSTRQTDRRTRNGSIRTVISCYWFN